jgi:hypothetical protein
MVLAQQGRVTLHTKNYPWTPRPMHSTTSMPATSAGRAILVPKAAPYPERQILIRLSRRCSQLHELARVS